MACVFYGLNALTEQLEETSLFVELDDLTMTSWDLSIKDGALTRFKQPTW